MSGSREERHLKQLDDEIKADTRSIISRVVIGLKFYFILMQDNPRGVSSVRDKMIDLSVISLFLLACSYFPVCQLRKNLAARRQVLQARSNTDGESLPNVSEGINWKGTFYLAIFYTFVQLCATYIELQSSQAVRPVVAISDFFRDDVMRQCLDPASSVTFMCHP